MNRDDAHRKLKANRDAQARLSQRVWELAMRADPTLDAEAQRLWAEERALLATLGSQALLGVSLEPSADCPLQQPAHCL